MLRLISGIISIFVYLTLPRVGMTFETAFPNKSGALTASGYSQPEQAFQTAGVYWLPDYLKDNIDSNSRTSDDSAKPVDCTVVGKTASCPSPQTCKPSAAFSHCCDDCVCDRSVYKYTLNECYSRYQSADLNQKCCKGDCYTAACVNFSCSKPEEQTKPCEAGEKAINQHVELDRWGHSFNCFQCQPKTCADFGYEQEDSFAMYCEKVSADLVDGLTCYECRSCSEKYPDYNFDNPDYSNELCLPGQTEVRAPGNCTDWVKCTGTPCDVITNCENGCNKYCNNDGVNCIECKALTAEQTCQNALLSKGSDSDFYDFRDDVTKITSNGSVYLSKDMDLTGKIDPSVTDLSFYTDWQCQVNGRLPKVTGTTGTSVKLSTLYFEGVGVDKVTVNAAERVSVYDSEMPIEMTIYNTKELEVYGNSLSPMKLTNYGTSMDRLQISSVSLQIDNKKSLQIGDFNFDNNDYSFETDSPIATDIVLSGSPISISNMNSYELTSAPITLDLSQSRVYVDYLNLYGYEYNILTRNTAIMNLYTTADFQTNDIKLTNLGGRTGIYNLNIGGSTVEMINQDGCLQAGASLEDTGFINGNLTTTPETNILTANKGVDSCGFVFMDRFIREGTEINYDVAAFYWPDTFDGSNVKSCMDSSTCPLRSSWSCPESTCIPSNPDYTGGDSGGDSGCDTGATCREIGGTPSCIDSRGNYFNQYLQTDSSGCISCPYGYIVDCNPASDGGETMHLCSDFQNLGYTVESDPYQGQSYGVDRNCYWYPCNVYTVDDTVLNYVCIDANSGPLAPDCTGFYEDDPNVCYSGLNARYADTCGGRHRCWQDKWDLWKKL